MMSHERTKGKNKRSSKQIVIDSGHPSFELLRTFQFKWDRISEFQLIEAIKRFGTRLRAIGKIF